MFIRMREAVKMPGLGEAMGGILINFLLFFYVSVSDDQG